MNKLCTLREKHYRKNFFKTLMIIRYIMDLRLLAYSDEFKVFLKTILMSLKKN